MFPEEAEVATLEHTPTYNATQQADDREALRAQLWACWKKKILVIPGYLSTYLALALKEFSKCLPQINPTPL